MQVAPRLAGGGIGGLVGDRRGIARGPIEGGFPSAAVAIFAIAASADAGSESAAKAAAGRAPRIDAVARASSRGIFIK